MKRAFALLALLALVAATPAPPRPHALPPGFVYLADVAPTIVQDVRYFTNHNFLGRPVRGYDAAECVLTAPAARALAKVQEQLEAAGMTLRVYDCYRPQRAVDDFIAWSKIASDQRMKAEFYPRVDKSQFFALGYVAAKSGHTRGSTVDLTVQRLPVQKAPTYQPGTHSCIAPWYARYHDGGLDMGTNFDCMDPLSHPDADVGLLARHHRQLLHDVMKRFGFKGIAEEWWHFTLRQEPYPSTYFDFPIEPRR